MRYTNFILIVFLIISSKSSFSGEISNILHHSLRFIFGNTSSFCVIVRDASCNNGIDVKMNDIFLRTALESISSLNIYVFRIQAPCNIERTKSSEISTGNSICSSADILIEIGSLHSISKIYNREREKLSILLNTDNFQTIKDLDSFKTFYQLRNNSFPFHQIIFTSSSFQDAFKYHTHHYHQEFFKARQGRRFSRISSPVKPYLTSYTVPPPTTVIPTPIENIFNSSIEFLSNKLKESIGELQIPIYYEVAGDAKLSHQNIQTVIQLMDDKLKKKLKESNLSHLAQIKSISYIILIPAYLASSAGEYSLGKGSFSSKSLKILPLIMSSANTIELATLLKSSSFLWMLLDTAEDVSEPLHRSQSHFMRAVVREGILTRALVSGCIPILGNSSQLFSLTAHQHELSSSSKYLLHHPAKISKLLVHKSNCYINMLRFSVVEDTVDYLSLPLTSRLELLRVAVTTVTKEQDFESIKIQFQERVIEAAQNAAFYNFIRDNYNRMRTGYKKKSWNHSLIGKSSTSTSSTVESTTPGGGPENYTINHSHMFGESGPGKRLTALIIEPRMIFEFEYCVRNVMYFLGSDWTLQVHHSTGESGNKYFVRAVLRGLEHHVQYVPLPFPVFDQSTYNKLVKSRRFWASLSLTSDHVLIFQSDSTMIRPGINRFLQYDYVGAPWSKNVNDPATFWLRNLNRHRVLLEGVGNGGFSLRNVQTMVILQNEIKTADTSFEDTCFVFLLEKSRKYQLPKRSIAYHFAIEKICEDIPLTLDIASIKQSMKNLSMIPFLPMALHAAWKYLTYDETMVLMHLTLPR